MFDSKAKMRKLFRQVADKNVFCHNMFTSSMPQLQRWAWHAINTTPEKNIVFCIQVDSCWKSLANKLLPGQDWQIARSHGLQPIAIGTTNWKEIESDLETIPVLKKAKDLKLSPGTVLVIVLSYEGGSAGVVSPVAPHSIQ